MVQITGKEKLEKYLMDKNISYAEYIAEKVSQNLSDYSNYIAQEIDKNINYTKYLSGVVGGNLRSELRKKKITNLFK